MPITTPVLVGARYELGPVLGRGGMAAVHLARDVRLGRDVALKVFRATPDSDGAARLQREATMLAGFGHPNLVAAFDAGMLPDDQGAWLALELMSGPNVAAMLRQRGRLTADEVRRLLRDVSDALAYIHARGIVHRDVKPANVLLTGDPARTSAWHAKLADFGIARIVDGASMTTTGTVIGTAAYFSPEQTRGDQVGIESDIYSLGLVAIEALTGRRAFPGSSVESATARLVRPPAIPDWIGGHWRGLLEAMTASDPRRRPTAAQLERACATRMPDLAAPARADEAATAPIDTAPIDEVTERVTAVHAAVQHAPTVLMAPVAADAPLPSRRVARGRSGNGSPATRRPPRRSFRGRMIAIAAGGALVVGGVTAAGALIGAAPAPTPAHTVAAAPSAKAVVPSAKPKATAKAAPKTVAAPVVKAAVPAAAVSTPPSKLSRWAKLVAQFEKRVKQQEQQGGTGRGGGAPTGNGQSGGGSGWGGGNQGGWGGSGWGH